MQWGRHRTQYAGNRKGRPSPPEGRGPSRASWLAPPGRAVMAQSGMTERGVRLRATAWVAPLQRKSPVPTVGGGLRTPRKLPCFRTAGEGLAPPARGEGANRKRKRRNSTMCTNSPFLSFCPLFSSGPPRASAPTLRIAASPLWEGPLPCVLARPVGESIATRGKRATFQACCHGARRHD